MTSDNAPGAPGDTVTIGVAIAVPEPYGAMLRDARESFGDDQARHIPTHVTLLPPTEVAAADIEQIDAHLREVAAHAGPFRIELRGTDSFRPVSEVVFVPLVQGASACAALANAVRQGPLRRDLEFSYHPHVTLGHDIDAAQLDAAEFGMRWVHIEFDVGAFSIYTRSAEQGWVHERDYPLGRADDAGLVGVWGKLSAPTDTDPG